MTEWRTIPGYDVYEISDAGVVRRRIAGKGSPVGKVLQSWLEPTGYNIVSLVKNGKPITFRVHRALCLAFHGDPPTPKHLAAHHDGDPQNNTPINVRWKTRKENSDDQLRHGRRVFGEDRSTKLTIDEARDIRLSDNELHRVIAARYGIARQTVSKIKRGVLWPHAV